MKRAYPWIVLGLVMGAIWQGDTRLGAALGLAAFLLWIFADEFTEGWE